MKIVFFWFIFENRRPFLTRLSSSFTNGSSTFLRTAARWNPQQSYVRFFHFCI